MFPIAEDSDRGDASPKSGLPSSAAPMASDSTRCAELLKSGDYNVTEAATMTGFNDLGHFREVFKKEFGVTPSETRSVLVFLIVHSVLANVIDYVYSTS